jgi:hypothetical protein
MGKAKPNRPVIAVADSVAGVTTEWELDKEFEGNGRVGYEAKQIRTGMRRLTPIVARNRGIVVFVNHAYQTMNKIGPSTPKSGGGHGIKFMSSLRIELTHKGELKSGAGEDVVRKGQEIAVKVRKSRGGELRNPNFDISLLMDGGFDQCGSLLYAATKVGMVKAETKERYSLDGQTFVEDQWREVMESRGGFDVMYPQMLAYGVENGQLEPWGAAVEGDDEDPTVQ